MDLIQRCLPVLLCLAATPPRDARQEWQLWFAEYDVASAEQARFQPALFIFKQRFVPAGKNADVESVQRFDVAGSFDVYKQGGAYFADTLPLFAPTPDKTSMSGGEYDCRAVAEATGYAVTCRSNYSGYTLRSFYEPTVGVPWFEYFCGYPQKVCRFEFSKGKMLFRREFIEAIEQSGDVRTGAPFRPKPNR